MKYSLPFYKQNPYLDTIDELIIKYDIESEPSLIGFLDNHPNQRIVLKISKDNQLKKENYKFLENIIDLYTKERIVCCFDSLELCAEAAALPHFFNYYCFTFDDVEKCLSLNATDIYIIGDLGYKLKYIKERYTCNLRVIPNLTYGEKKEKNFFIRPEDLKYYEEYIDYIEFFAAVGSHLTEIYKIYVIDKHYEGWLDDLIIGAPPCIYNPCITSTLAIEHLNCQKGCQLYKKCNICEKIYTLARTMYKNSYKIREEKK